MSDADSPKIMVFDQDFEVENGSINPTHTMSEIQAHELERYYPGATSLQDAIRAACREGLDERKESIAAAKMEEVADNSREILNRLDAIHQSLDD